MDLKCSLGTNTRKRSKEGPWQLTAMSLADLLVNVRQQSIDKFLSSGGDKTATPRLGFEAAPFVRDAALLTHPVYSTCIAYCRGTNESAVEDIAHKQYAKRLVADALQLSTPTTYSARQNKYGVSTIQFDHQGALLATGGSNGIVRIYDFDEYYVRTQLRHTNSTPVGPVVQFDTRRDISSITWSHLRPDDIAVAYLFRPEVHIFDISQVEGSGGAEEVPTRILETDSKSGSGNNVVMYWHSVTYESAPTNRIGKPAAVCKESEGVVAGSASGHLRYWTTSVSPSARSNSRACLWSVLADPHRTTATASPVVALLAVQRCNRGPTTGNPVQTVDPLLLAATAQGVITLWDLLLLRPATFGSTKPEPKCIRRVDCSAPLLLGGGVTVIGVCLAQTTQCRLGACGKHHGGHDHGAAGESVGDGSRCRSLLDSESEWRQQCVQVVNSNGSEQHAKSSSGASPEAPVRAALLLTLSSGAVYQIELHSDTCQLVQPASACDTLAGAIHPDSGAALKRHLVNNDPREATIVSFEELRREAALTSAAVTAIAAARDEMSHRTVLPVVLPSWTHTAAHRGHQSAVEAECPSSDLARRLQATCTVGGYEEIVSASAALLVRPTRDSTGTALLALDLQPPVTERVYPYMYDEGGRYSITGKDSDRWNGVTKSNMRRGSEISTTLPGHVISAEPGSAEVVVSHDLQAYLCAEVALGSSYSKCSDVRFEWTHLHGALAGPVDPEELAVAGPGGSPYTHTWSDNTVAQVSPHRIILTEPYVGPLVLHGVPRVLVRAALLPCGRTANVTAAAVPGRSAQKEGAVKHFGAATVTEQYTALCAHPVHPFLVAGTRTDQVLVINPMHNHHVEEDTARVTPEDTAALARLAAEEAEAIVSRRGLEWWRRVLPIREGDPVLDTHATEAGNTADPMEEVEAPVVTEVMVDAEAGQYDVGVEIGADTTISLDSDALAENDTVVDLRSPTEVLAKRPLSDVSCASTGAISGSSGSYEVGPEGFIEMNKVPRVGRVADDPTTAGDRTTEPATLRDGLLSARSHSSATVTSSADCAVSIKLPSTAATAALAAKHVQSSSFPSLRVGAVPAAPPKRNLLSSLARAKENVPLFGPTSSADDGSAAKAGCASVEPKKSGAAAAVARFAVATQASASSATNTFVNKNPIAATAEKTGTALRRSAPSLKLQPVPTVKSHGSDRGGGKVVGGGVGKQSQIASFFTVAKK